MPQDTIISLALHTVCTHLPNRLHVLCMHADLACKQARGASTLYWRKEGRRPMS